MSWWSKPVDMAREPRRTSQRTARRTPRSPTRRRPAPRPLGPHPVERGSVRIPVRNALGTFEWCKVHPGDYPLAMRHLWRLDRQGYPTTSVWNLDTLRSTALTLHRLIARAPRGVLVDHVRQNLLDCRRCALRWATHSENTANSRVRRRGRSSRYRGVTLHKQTGRWQAAAKHLDKNHYLGLFDTEEEAAIAYNRKAKAFWGRFAILNRVPRLERKAA